jgi:hypothetical protein
VRKTGNREGVVNGARRIGGDAGGSLQGIRQISGTLRTVKKGNEEGAGRKVEATFPIIVLPSPRIMRRSGGEEHFYLSGIRHPF